MLSGSGPLMMSPGESVCHHWRKSRSRQWAATDMASKNTAPANSCLPFPVLQWLLHCFVLIRQNALQGPGPPALPKICRSLVFVQPLMPAASGDVPAVHFYKLGIPSASARAGPIGPRSAMHQYHKAGACALAGRAGPSLRPLRSVPRHPGCKHVAAIADRTNDAGIARIVLELLA